MPTSLQNLTLNSIGANMLATWVSMLNFASNHVCMAFLHVLACLNLVEYSFYMYVKKSLQLGFGGLKKHS